MNTKTAELIIKRRASKISEDIDHSVSFGRQEKSESVELDGRPLGSKFRDENQHLSSMKNDGTAPYMFMPGDDNTVIMRVIDSTNPVRVMSENIAVKDGRVAINEDTEIRIGEYILEIRVKYPVQQEEESISMKQEKESTSMKSLGDDMDQNESRDQNKSQDMGFL